MSPSIYDVLEFLTTLFEKGLQYSTIAAARSALSGIIHVPGVSAISEHPLVVRLLKGIFNKRPPQPRYEFIWDTNLVISFMRGLKNSEITFKMLSLKTVTLLTLLSGQRVSTIQKFKISELQCTPSLIIFNISGLLKQSRPGKKDKPICFHAFPHDTHLCPIATVESYLSARATLPNTSLHDPLIVCYRKPHGPATKDTIARWVKSMLHLCGVDVNTFAAHSCRSASSSKARSAGVKLETILKAGQWSKESTFYRFYQKDIVLSSNIIDNSFAASIVNTS